MPPGGLIPRGTKTRLEMSMRPGNPDRAWNDPPMLPLNASADAPPQAAGLGSSPATVATKRTPLNKRVAFPMSGPISPPTTGQNAPINVSPPMYLPAGPPPADISGTTVASQLPNQPPIPILLPPLITLEQDQALRLERLNSFMTKIREKLSDYDKFLETKIKEDIERRLQALEVMWTEKKLSLDVENRLCMFAKKLQEGQLEAAETSFLALVADYADTCASWGIGLEHLISAVKKSEACS